VILPPAIRSGATPATEPEMRPVEIRDGAGRLLRKLPLSKAEELVERGYGERRRASNGRWFVSMYGGAPSIQRGPRANETTVGRQEHKQHHPRCAQWRQPA
jgi:hypothetical protein